MKKQIFIFLLLVFSNIQSYAKNVVVNITMIDHSFNWTLKSIDILDSQTICNWEVSTREEQSLVWMTEDACLIGPDGQKWKALKSTLPTEKNAHILKKGNVYSFQVIFPRILRALSRLDYYSSDLFYVKNINIIGEQKDIRTSVDDHFRDLINKAASNDANAMYELGTVYQDGYAGVDIDYKKSFEYLKRAAELGHAEANFTLANMLEYVNRKEQAFSFYLRAAEFGDRRAMYMVGLYYNRGDGTNQDYEKAAFWYSEAIKHDVSFAYNDMAYLYMNGNGVNKDVNHAFELVNKAIQLNPKNPGFLDTLGEFYLQIGDFKKANEIWGKLQQLDSQYVESEKTVFVEYMSSINESQQNSIQSHITKNTFVVIIANEEYKYVADVPFARNDGESFKLTCLNNLNIPSNNILSINNATYNDIRHSVKWLQQVVDAYNGDTNIIFYYAGHGIPDEATKNSLLLPIDGTGNDASTGYNLRTLYESLGNIHTQSVLVFLDACFSGAKRDGGVITQTRGVAVKPKEAEPTNNMVVFSASMGNQMASAYNDKEHGLFTYYLTKALQESNGSISLGDLVSKISSQVAQQSIVINKKPQNPSVISSTSIGDKWKKWVLK